VPRNIDPAPAKLENISLYNIDDLEELAQGGVQARERELAAVSSNYRGARRGADRELHAETTTGFRPKNEIIAGSRTVRDFLKSSSNSGLGGMNCVHAPHNFAVTPGSRSRPCA